MDYTNCMLSYSLRMHSHNKDYSGMPTALNEALSSGSPEVIACVAQACNKAMETVSF